MEYGKDSNVDIGLNESLYDEHATFSLFESERNVGT